MNPLVDFSGNLSGVLPSLKTIDATGITQWKPERKLLQLNILQTIIGQPYSSKYCTGCLIYKDNSTSVFPVYYVYGSSCVTYRKSIDRSFHYVKMLNNTSYRFRCHGHMTMECYKRRIYSHWHQIINHCWGAMQVSIKCEGAIGLVAVIFNTVAFVTIFTSQRLRQNVSMCLVCNMAFSDCLIGIYMVAISIYLNDKSYKESYFESGNDCWKMGFLWMLGQAGSVQTTFLLTLERYLVIVHSLRPELRISRRTAFLLIVICWLIAFTFTAWAFISKFYGNNFLCLPIDILSGNRRIFFFTLMIGSLALFFYMLSFLLYIHIYIAAKRTGQNAGVKRESKLAKRIALLVFTNMFFFFFPVLCMGAVTLALPASVLQYSTNAFRSIILNVFPTLCLCVNSCCNPILHAFRQDNFKVVLKQRIPCITRLPDFCRAFLNMLVGLCRHLSDRKRNALQSVSVEKSVKNNKVQPAAPEQ